jgi:benzodiazapine receptor
MSDDAGNNWNTTGQPQTGMPGQSGQASAGGSRPGPAYQRGPAFPETVARSSYSALIGAFIVCFAVAAIGSAFVISNLSPWYAALAKPGFALPSWIYWPVQMMLYALMALSVWMVWEQKAPRSVKFPALFVFGMQLLLNLAWPAMFFGAQSPGLGLIVIGVLVAAILATILSFYRISKWAALLLCPHLLWVCYETVLNIAIWWMN